MRRFIVTAIATLLIFAGCNQQTATKPSAATQTNAAATNRQVFHVRGVVKEMLSSTRAKIDHEAIPGYMPAMTMPLDVKNTNEFANIKAGDRITFDMVVTDDDGWIEKVARVGEAPVVTGDTNQGVTFTKTRVVQPLAVDDTMTDYPFLTEDGKTIRLSDFKGQALGFTFIFTRCPFPTFCPKMTSNFEKAAAELSKTGGPTNWHLLSISFDPDYDTPARLKEHAQRFKRNPAKWTFVTGEKSEIEAIADQLGLIMAFRNGTIDHNLRTVIVDAKGHIRQIYVGNEWNVNEFVEEMKKAAAPVDDATAKP